MQIFQIVNRHYEHDENLLLYKSGYVFDIRSYARRNENKINTLKIEIQSENKCIGFDYFSRIIKKIQNVKELTIKINMKLDKEKGNTQSRSKEVLDFLVDTLIPLYKDKIETITILELQIQERSEKDEEKTIKNYLLKILKPLKFLRTISFRQNHTEVRSQNFYSLKQFIQLLKEKSLDLPNLKLLDFQLMQKENQINIKSFNQKEILDNMQSIAKDLSKINQLEELQLRIQNLGLERVFFDNLISSIVQIKKLKKLGLDISNNRITAEQSIKNIKRLQDLSSKLESFVYIDSQQLKTSSVKEFSQVMKSFENLTFLQLGQLTFKQGSSIDFYSFLSFLPQLQDISLDLGGVQFNTNDCDYLTKQIKQLTNLTSIKLNIPQFNQQEAEDQIQFNLIEIIKSFKDQLLSFQLVIHFKFQSLEYEDNLIEEISHMQKLKFISFLFPNSKVYSNEFLVDSRQQNCENIWNLKSLECLQQEYYYRYNNYDFIKKIQQKLALKQNPEILENLIITSDKISKEEQDSFNDNLVELKKFNKLKSLTYISNTSIENFIKATDILIQNNLNNLTHLKLSQYSSNFCIGNQQILKLVQNCKLLYHLDVKVDFTTDQFLQQIFSELIYLQKFYTDPKFKSPIFPQAFDNANYLTEFKYFFTDRYKIQSMLYQRQVYILQNIIYSQIIQPYIIFQPQLSHLDIVFN